MTKMASADSPPEGTVSVESCWKVFGHGSRRVIALRDIDITVPTGKFVSIIGPSGCGKSTLISVVSGLTTPTRGEVRIGGHRVLKPYTAAGIVFQRDLLLEWRSALQNILLQFELRGESPRPHHDRAYELLHLVGIEREFAQKLPRQLSGGMRQRVAICRALVHDPDLLLMDEPFGALDALTREELNLDLAGICAYANKTVLFITHSIPEAVFLSDKVVVMSPRPGTVRAEFEIDLPRPRDSSVRDAPAFGEYVRELRHLLGQGRKARTP